MYHVHIIKEEFLDRSDYSELINGLIKAGFKVTIGIKENLKADVVMYYAVGNVKLKNKLTEVFNRIDTKINSSGMSSES